MKIALDGPIWLVTNPTPKSELGDIFSMTTLRQLELQFKGGLTAAENPTIFSDKAEAEVEARIRLDLLRRAERAGEN